jgi:hypothetical protein
MKTLKLRPCSRTTGFPAGTCSRTPRRVRLFQFAAFLALLVALMSNGAYAQSQQDLATQPPPAAVDPGPQSIDPYATAGPKIYITDSAGKLATVTLGTYAVHIIGSTGAALTDIAFNPKDGQLYGVTFTGFYRVNTTTAKATFIGKLGISDANALVFDGQGVAYTQGVNSPELYTINRTTGKVSPVGSTKPFKSAGDLTFYAGGLVLSGYSQSALENNTPDTLVLLNPKTGAVLGYSELKIANLFGIVCTGKDLLFGFAGTNLYQLFPGQSNIDKRAVLRKDLSGTGLTKIYGAAYDGYFLY